MTRNRPQTDSDRRPKTVSISLCERGQTTQDFAVGIGVFILAVAFVFSFLPTLLTPFDSSVTGGQTAQADRIGDRIVHDLSAEYDEPNAINGSAFYHEYADAPSDTDAFTGLGVRDVGDRVNVRLEHVNGTAIDDEEWTAGSTYRNQSAASSARLVTVEGLEASSDPDDPGCDPACRLVVRVW